MAEVRAATQFKPGRSGNPGGLTKETRAKQTAHREFCLEHLPRAALLHVSVIDEAIACKEAGQPVESYPKDWQRSVDYLTHYGVGKPKEMVEITGADGGPMEMIDYSGLSEEELLTALALQRKARAAKEDDADNS